MPWRVTVSVRNTYHTENTPEAEEKAVKAAIWGLSGQIVGMDTEFIDE
tara:strand:+ start:26 stop:169 length:144 start_codon:yes stop_codon:yes gene_type:complete